MNPYTFGDSAPPSPHHLPVETLFPPVRNIKLCTFGLLAPAGARHPHLKAIRGVRAAPRGTWRQPLSRISAPAGALHLHSAAPLAPLVVEYPLPWQSPLASFALKGRYAVNMSSTRHLSLVLVGSPRVGGRCAAIASELARELGHSRQSGTDVAVWPLAEHSVAGCTGCGACGQSGECAIDDDWAELESLLGAADELFVVAPVYFSGPSPALASALSRMQVFWARRYRLGCELPPERDAHLVVVGDGGDSFGTSPLETVCTSALNSTGLRLAPERIWRLIGEGDETRDAGAVAAVVHDIARDVVQDVVRGSERDSERDDSGAAVGR